MASFREIILRTVGDGESARRDLKQTAAELEAFDRIKAEASAELDDSKLKAQLKEAKARLAELSKAEATPEVDLATAKATGEIKALQARLTELAAKHYEVEVDIDPHGLVETRLAAMAAQTDKGGGALARFGAAFRGLSSIAMISIASIIIALLPMISTIGYAAAALGALTIAAIGAAAAMLPLLAGAIVALTKGLPGAEAATTALKDAFSKLGDEFKKIAAPGVIAMFRGLTPLIESLTSDLGKLQPGVTALGQSFGTAFKNARPQVSLLTGEFGKLMQATSPIAGPLISSLVSLGRIITNIARAAMPFLIDGFRNLAQALREFADATANVKNARRIIGGWMDDLAAIWNLIKAIGNAIGALFAPLAQKGKQTTQALADLLNKFADWARTAEGQAQIKKFFSDVGAAIAIVLELILKLGPPLLVFVEAAGKAGTLLLEAFNGFLDAIKSLPQPLSDALMYLLGFVIIGSKLFGLGTAFRVIGVGLAAISYAGGLAVGMLGMLALMFAPVIIFAGLLYKAFQALPGVISAIGGAASSAFGWIKTAASDAFGWVVGAAQTAWSGVKSAVSTAINFVLHLPGNMVSLAQGIWNGVKGVISAVVNFVLRLPGNLVGLARGIWNGVKGVISAVINFVIHLPIISDLISTARDIWNAINSAMPDIHIGVSVDTPKIPIIGSPVHWFDNFTEAGKAMASYIQNGLNAEMVTPSFTPTNAARVGPSLALAALGDVSGGQTNHFEITTPEGDAPDAATMLAQISTKLRARGGVG